MSASDFTIRFSASATDCSRTTAYSAYPWVPEIPDRVKSVVPGARIVYVVREPVERMLSHYAQNVWDRFPVRPFDEPGWLARPPPGLRTGTPALGRLAISQRLEQSYCDELY